MVRKAWGPRTKGLLLGSPSNPTGNPHQSIRVEGHSGLIAEQHGVLMVDEIYRAWCTAWSVDRARPAGGVVLINRFSKYFCMTAGASGVVLP